MNWRELKEKNVSVMGGALSGGLDSCTVTHWLRENGFEVQGFTVDLGQPDEENLEAITDRMMGCGASDAIIVPGRAELAEAGLRVIQSQARYEGGYWNTTGIARPITVAAILSEMRERGIGVMFHGATGRGNDQVRMQLAANMIDPNTEVYAPWRDPEFVDRFPGRLEMIEYCESNGLPIRPAREARYSTDANFLGLTHEAGDLEDVTISPTFVEPGMGVWPWDAPNQSQVVTIRWERGVPVSIDDEPLDLEGAFETANSIAGRPRCGYRHSRGGESLRRGEIEGNIRVARDGTAGTELRISAPVYSRPTGARILQPCFAGDQSPDIPGILARPCDKGGAGRARAYYGTCDRHNFSTVAQGSDLFRYSGGHAGRDASFLCTLTTVRWRRWGLMIIPTPRDFCACWEYPPRTWDASRG